MINPTTLSQHVAHCLHTLAKKIGDRTEERRRVIEPNRDSAAKIERYSMGLSLLALPGHREQLSCINSPDTNFRTQEIRCNITEPGIFYLQSFRVANVDCLIGGETDAYQYRDGLVVDLPTLTPANRVTVLGRYTGKIPAAWKHEPALVAEQSAEALGRMRKLLENFNRMSPDAVYNELKKIDQLHKLEQINFVLSGPATIVA